MNISKRLISLMQQCGLTQNGLAERAGVSQLLCDAMSISLKEFFDEAASEDDIAIAFSRLSPKQKKLLLAFLESL